MALSKEAVEQNTSRPRISREVTPLYPVPTLREFIAMIPELEEATTAYIQYLDKFKTLKGKLSDAATMAYLLEGEHPTIQWARRRGLELRFSCISRPESVYDPATRKFIPYSPRKPYSFHKRQELASFHTRSQIGSDPVFCWIQNTDYVWLHRVRDSCNYALPIEVRDYLRHSLAR